MTMKTLARENTINVGMYHLEWHMSVTSGERVAVECECAIGVDHTLTDWLQSFGSAGTA